MNRSTARTKVVIWSIVAVLTIGAIGSGVVFSQVGFSRWFGSSANSKNMRVVKDVTLSEDVKSLRLTWYVGDAQILKSTDGKIRIVQKSSRDLSEKQQFYANVSGGELTVEDRVKGSSIFHWGPMHNYLELYLPEKEYESMVLGSASGSLRGDDLNAKVLEAKNTSGDLTLRGAFSAIDLENTSGSTRCETTANAVMDAQNTSGKIEVSGPFTALKLHTTSGNIDARSTVSGTLESSTSSGGMDIEGNFTDITTKNASGNTRITSKELPQRLNGQVFSGGLKLYFPKDAAGFRLNLKKSSGGFESDFELKKNGDTYTYGEEKGNYQISVSSGNVDLNEN